jgi:ankyrin repeat protein
MSSVEIQSYWRLWDIDEGYQRNAKRPCYPLYYAAASLISQPERLGRGEEVIDLLLKHGTDPLAKYENSNSVLHSLVEGNALVKPMRRFLLPNIEQRGMGGRTLFLSACQACMNMSMNWADRDNFLDTLNELLDSGAEVSAVDEKGRNALHYLAPRLEGQTSKRLALIRRILSLSPQLANQPDNTGLTPLHYTAQRRIMPPINELLTAGADPLLPDNDGNIILHLFANYGWDSSTQSELRALFSKVLPVDPSAINCRNTLGETPVFSYIKSGSMRSVESIKLFTDSEADLNIRNNSGETLLHILAKGDGEGSRSHVNLPFQDMFQYLMDRGVDPMVEDEQNRTAVDVAATVGSTAILKLFSRET